MMIKREKKIKAIRRIICCILTLIWMMVIFSFSAQNADESSVESNAVGMFVGHIFVSGFDKADNVEQMDFVDTWDYSIRKVAHMTEYAVLGILLVGALERNEVQKTRVTACLAFLISMLYAVLDEIHQYFVPGRACRLYDVGFDLIGALIGILIGTSLFVLCNRN